MSKTQRHHHLNRLKNKRKCDLVITSLTDFTNFSPNNNRQKHLARHLIAPEPCSCWLCGNPRKFYGNGKQAKTIKELKAVEVFISYQDELWQGSA